MGLLQKGEYSREGNTFAIGDNKFFIVTRYGNKNIKLIKKGKKNIRKHITKLERTIDNIYIGDEIVNKAKEYKQIKIGPDKIKIEDMNS